MPEILGIPPSVSRNLRSRYPRGARHRRMRWGPVVVVLWLSALAGLIQLVDGYVGTQLKGLPQRGDPSPWG